LIACTSSPSPGGQTTTRVSASARSRLGLSGADGLDDDASKPAASKQSTAARRAREAAELAARRERADEGVRMRAVFAHADAVAEHRAAGDRARRIDRDHGDPLAARQPCAAAAR
jgi:hypothetical protein